MSIDLIHFSEVEQLKDEEGHHAVCNVFSQRKNEICSAG